MTAGREGRLPAEEPVVGELRLRTLLEGIPQVVWCAVDGGAWTWSSPQWGRLTGQSAEMSLGRGWLAAIHPEDRAETERIWHRASVEAPLKIEHRIFDVSVGRYRWFQTMASPVTDRSGGLVEWLGTSTDIDELRRLEDAQRLLLAELQHRTRNLIAVVQSIAQQTMTRSDSMDEFARKFERRLRSLARVQGLLSRAEGNPIGIGELVRMEIDALYPEDVRRKVVVEGPEAPLRRSAVQTLALAIHELATNAGRYGALANPDGSLLIRWSTVQSGEESRLVLTWEERFGASAADVPGSVGYGRELIERALPYSLQAETSYVISPGSVRCVIDLPLSDRGQREAG
jgi:two-component system CheB/CheR fusion protein